MTGPTQPKPLPSFAEACDPGLVREENQDSVRHVSTPMGELVLVADGIGGYRGGGTASRIVVETFASWVSARPPNYSAALAIAEAAAKRNVQTVAEHIEDANTMAVVWQLGVQYIQGYFLDAPEEVVLKS